MTNFISFFSVCYLFACLELKMKWNEQQNVDDDHDDDNNNDNEYEEKASHNKKRTKRWKSNQLNGIVCCFYWIQNEIENVEKEIFAPHK